MHGLIELFLQAGQWYAQCEDPEVIHLFGSDTIPTPYTEGTDGNDVVKELKALNPHATVRLRG